jgi:hypothetical protein
MTFSSIKKSGARRRPRSRHSLYQEASRSTPRSSPLLAAEIGITAVDLQGVAQAVTSTALAWTQVAAVIETARLKAKRDIAEANTTAEINAILSAIAWGA